MSSSITTPYNGPLTFPNSVPRDTRWYFDDIQTNIHLRPFKTIISSCFKCQVFSRSLFRHSFKEYPVTDHRLKGSQAFWTLNCPCNPWRTFEASSRLQVSLVWTCAWVPVCMEIHTFTLSLWSFSLFFQKHRGGLVTLNCPEGRIRVWMFVCMGPCDGPVFQLGWILLPGTQCSQDRSYQFIKHLLKNQVNKLMTPALRPVPSLRYGSGPFRLALS